jgi:hypothetical protein
MFSPCRHTVPIFRFDSRYPWLNGTGVFIIVDNQHFVVTAAHVVEASARKIAFGYQPPDQAWVDMFGHEALPIIKAQAQANERDPQRAVYRDGLDLAIIMMPTQHTSWLKERYTPFDLRSNQRPEAVGVVIVAGWPARTNKYDERKRQFGDRFGCYPIQSQALDKELVRKMGGDPETHIALQMDKDNFIDISTGKPAGRLFALNGVSGGGVWDMYLADQDQFPNCARSLAGIIVEDHDDKNMAMAIRADNIWYPLVQKLGLRPH